MSLKNKSEISAISGPEFINLQPLDVNPLMDSCEIKVFYLGTNRNGSYINKETAMEMAKTLRGTPIVAAWNPQKEDFGDHGHIIHVEDGEITFSCKTVPYGFVSPDAQVWFQNFVDTDEFENKVERTYLMTTGYLWSGQFEELKKVIAEGQPHSMELDEKTLEGHWATDNNSGIEFFIINDAVFSKLCILGDDVEPCFEGSAVTSPEVSKNFSVQKEFSQTLFTMMNELKDALHSKGGLDMPKEFAEQTETAIDESAESEFTETVTEEITELEVNEEPVDYTSEEAPADVDADAEGEFEKKDDDKDDSDDSNDDSDSEDKDEDEEEEKPAASHSLDELAFAQLQEEVEILRAENEALKEFKLNVENKEKDALIASYHMLSEEDKAEVIEHKSEYSLDEIKSKLAVIYVEKNVDFSTLDGKPEFESQTEESEEEDPAMTFSLDSEPAGFVDPLQAALRRTLQ